MNMPNWMKGSLRPDMELEGYLSRWWIIPRNQFFNIYLHNFVGDDDDRAAHDHPWWSFSFLLKGRLQEEVQVHQPHGHRYEASVRTIKWLAPYFREATHAHIMRLQTKNAWTLFITGPRIREWGFWVSEPVILRARISRWVHHEKFLNKYGKQTRSF